MVQAPFDGKECCICDEDLREGKELLLGAEEIGSKVDEKEVWEDQVVGGNGDRSLKGAAQSHGQLVWRIYPAIKASSNCAHNKKILSNFTYPVFGND